MTTTKTFLLGLNSLIAVALLSLTAVAIAENLPPGLYPTYRLQEIPLINTDATSNIPIAINNSRQVLINERTLVTPQETFHRTAVISLGQAPTRVDISVSGTFQVIGKDINQGGTVVGFFELLNRRRAFRWQNGIGVDISVDLMHPDTPGSSDFSSAATSISDSGIIYGVVSGSSELNDYLFRWESGAVDYYEIPSGYKRLAHWLDSFGNYGPHANELDEIAFGVQSNGSLPSKTFILRSSGLSSLALGTPYDFSSIGQASGMDSNQPNGQRAATDGFQGFMPLHQSCDGSSIAYAVNSSVTGGVCSGKAVVWGGTSMYYLINRVLNPQGWSNLASVRSLNETGDIVGLGISQAGLRPFALIPEDGILPTPTPTPRPTSTPRPQATPPAPDPDINCTSERAEFALKLSEVTKILKRQIRLSRRTPTASIVRSVLKAKRAILTRLDDLDSQLSKTGTICNLRNNNLNPAALKKLRRHVKAARWGKAKRIIKSVND